MTREKGEKDRGERGGRERGEQHERGEAMFSHAILGAEQALDHGGDSGVIGIYFQLLVIGPYRSSSSW